MTNKNTFNSTTHYRNWTITLDYKSEKICWNNSTNECGSWELIGSSIHDDKFINWKINKILQIIDEIIKKEIEDLKEIRDFENKIDKKIRDQTTPPFLLGKVTPIK